MTPPAPTRRMLADESLVIDYDATGDDSSTLYVGDDGNLDDSEVADVDVEIPQDPPTEATDAIDAVNVEEDTPVGDDSNSDDIDPTSSSSGTSAMTWIMYIGGAVLVLALLAGCAYMVMQNKDAADFEHENTEMTHV